MVVCFMRWNILTFAQIAIESIYIYIYRMSMARSRYRQDGLLIKPFFLVQTALDYILFGPFNSLGI